MRRTPYLVPIVDAFQDRDIEEVDFCKSAQIAGTEGMVSVIGYYADQEPCPIMFVLADEDTAVYMGTERIQPMFRDSSDLSRLVIESQFNKGEMTLANGSYIVLGWASSVAKLASRPMRLVICDEVDKPGYYLNTREGSSIYLAKQRLEAKFRGKFGLLGTPTTEEGNICKALKKCDVVYDWHVPCPYCGTLQPLRWSLKHATGFSEGMYRGVDGVMRNLGQVTWEGGTEATDEQIARAGYRCGECGKLWTTVQKNRAVGWGRMVARQEPKRKPKVVGFHVNRLYSLLGKSGDIPRMVEEWIRVKLSGDLGELQGWINNALAEPWVIRGEQPKAKQLLELRNEIEPGICPEGSVAVTLGVDVQKVGFYYTVWAWKATLDSQLIEYGFLLDWEDVARVAFESQFPVIGGGSLGVWRGAIDTGGGKTDEPWTRTEEIYEWLRMNGRGIMWGIKGFGGKGKDTARVKMSVIDKLPGKGKRIPGGLVLWSIDVDYFKDTFFWRLSKEGAEDPQQVRLHSEVREDFIDHLLAEEKRRNKQGVYEWVQVSRANHWLDSSVYAHACADVQWAGGIRAFMGQRPGRRGRRVLSKGVE